MGWLGAAYPYVKAGHVIFVIFWMAGLFMLPRFFIYHQEAEPGTREWEQWIERERRLIRIILHPAMVITWALGLMLAWNIWAGPETWFRIKLVPVLILAAYHLWMCNYAKRLAAGGPLLAGKTLRLLNEVPGLAAIVIVIMAVARPF
jgi:putative membrane protein